MPTFTYKARDRGGETRTGTLDSDSEATLVRELRTRGWLVVEVRPPATRRSWSPLGWLPPSSGDVILTLSQLAIMLKSGLTLLSALKTSAEYARRRSMRAVLTAVGQQVQEGSSLADALARHRCFDDVVVQLVRVGEHTGNLQPVLTRAAALLESRRSTRRNLLNALAYPVLVLVMAIGVTGFMLLFAIPKLQSFLTNLGKQLPPSTQLLLDLSAFAQEHAWTGLFGSAALVGLYVFVRSVPRGRRLTDRVLLRVPLIGGLFRLAGTGALARALGMLLRSGVRVVEGLRVAEDLLGNRHLAAKVAEVREHVLKGGALAEPLNAPGAFMPMLARMVAVGETSGSLDDVLDDVASFHDEQLAIAVRQLSSLIEPVITIVVGGIVGFVYISFFLALFAAAGA